MEPKWAPAAWEQLADEVKAGRDTLGLTQAEFAVKAGVGLRMLQDLEAGIPRGRMPRYMPRIERALGWRHGTARQILADATPGALAPPLRPTHLSRAEKDVVHRFLDLSKASAATKRQLHAEVESIPETNEETARTT